MGRPAYGRLFFQKDDIWCLAGITGAEVANILPFPTAVFPPLENRCNWPGSNELNVSTISVDGTIVTP